MMQYDMTVLETCSVVRSKYLSKIYMNVLG